MKECHITQKDFEELAEFWDTHDITDFEDEFEEVKEPVFKRRKELKIKLEPEDAGKIERLVKSKGISGIELNHA